MGISATILEKLRRLPTEDQQKVVTLVEQLAALHAPQPLKNPMGMFAHHGVDMPLEMFQEARDEMWANFPRDFPKTGDP